MYKLSYILAYSVEPNPLLLCVARHHEVPYFDLSRRVRLPISRESGTQGEEENRFDFSFSYHCRFNAEEVTCFIGAALRRGGIRL